MQRHTKSLLFNPRAKYKARARVIFEGYGYQITELSGDEGAYWDVVFPEASVRELPYFNLCVSGSLECLNEIDGVWYYNDTDHPLSVVLGQDGKPTDKIHEVRSPGITRMFFGSNTRRLCVYPVDSFGQASAEPIGFEHFRGPADLVLPRGAIFIISNGSMLANGMEVQSPNVLYAKTTDVRISLPANAYGGMSWKL
jgi:hypothetical protein